MWEALRGRLSVSKNHFVNMFAIHNFQYAALLPTRRLRPPVAIISSFRRLQPSSLLLPLPDAIQYEEQGHGAAKTNSGKGDGHRCAVVGLALRKPVHGGGGGWGYARRSRRYHREDRKGKKEGHGHASLPKD